jgi:hypothetical protein
VKTKTAKLDVRRSRKLQQENERLARIIQGREEAK